MARKSSNQAFADHVTSLAFSLTLSKNMIISLTHIAGKIDKYPSRGIYTAFGCYDTFIATGRALEERGLVYAKDPESPGIYSLTEAGKHVFQLLVIAGLVERIEIANRELQRMKKAAR